MQIGFYRRHILFKSLFTFCRKLADRKGVITFKSLNCVIFIYLNIYRNCRFQPYNCRIHTAAGTALLRTLRCIKTVIYD